ncbi:MAG: sirohydrochlorin cobaltochelatase [Oscillospiraceae bacterium]
MKRAILAVSFGTSFDDTREKTIEAIRHDFQAEYPDFYVESAFTSGMIIRSLKKRGVNVLNVPEAMASLLSEGFDEVFIQPTHIIKGEEFDKLCFEAKAFSGRFLTLKIGSPLLSTEADKNEVVQIISKNYSSQKKRAVVLMGHGTTHHVNPVYSEMNERFKAVGRNDIFVGTVEAAPSIDDVLSQLKAGGYNAAILAPFMLVAGDHANNDMASNKPDSWKSILEKNNILVTAVLKGLGEYPEIRDLYLKHLKKVMEE